MVWFNYITAFRSNLDDAAQEEEYMPCRLHLPLAVALLAGSVSLQAQETVVGASDPDALFHSSDPRLDANKQVVYHIVKNLLEAGHRSEEHTSELQSRLHLVCRLLLEKKKKKKKENYK